MDRDIKILGHNRRNAELRYVFLSKRVDLHETRVIDFHFWAWNRTDAENLVKDLCQHGFSVLAIKTVLAEHGRDIWNVEAQSLMSIEDAIETDCVAQLVDLASRSKADYDGCCTSV